MKNVGVVALLVIVAVVFWGGWGFIMARLARRRPVASAANPGSAGIAAATEKEPQAEEIAKAVATDDRPTEALAQILERDKDAQRRRDAAVTLGKRGDAAAVEALIGSVKRDAVGVVRLAAIDALMHAKEHDTRAAAFLTSALNNRHEDVRNHVARNLGQAAIPELTRLLRNPDQAIRLRTIDTLGQIRDIALDPLLEALEDSDARVRRHAMMKLKGISSPRLVESVMKLLEDPEPDIRLDTIRMLERIDRSDNSGKGAGLVSRDFYPQIRGALESTLKDSGNAARLDAIHMLVSLKDRDAVDTIADVLREDSDAEVRAAAADALGALGDARAIVALTAALDDPGEIFKTRQVHNWAIEGDPVEDVSYVADTVRGRVRHALSRLISNSGGAQ